MSKIMNICDQSVIIYNCYDFPYDCFENVEQCEGRSKKSNYANIISTFDIETTTITQEECTILNGDFGFMYVWQFCIDGVVCMGRTWEEFKAFLFNLKYALNYNGKKTLVCYVHNLSFEFQFMRNFFNVTKIFATEKRKPIYAVMDNIEFRCSYRLTNMSLAKFLQKTRGVTFFKQDGEKFDYRTKRYPDTKLTDSEIEYCVCDVLGLWQALSTYMEEDTLASIPLTSTGYVRRDYQNECLNYHGYKAKILNTKLDEHTYLLSKEASRGAIAGSNSLYTDEILYDIDSEDIKSSYPYQMCTKYFPASRFIHTSCKYIDDKFMKYLETKCCLITWSCKNLKLKKWHSIPYISKAKCRAIMNAKCGNGKVFMAERIGMTCTEIDFKIISEDYYFEDAIIHEMYICERDLLPYPFRKHLLEMFQHKTDLEGGDPYDYMKYKNKINASFGMMLTDIVFNSIKYNPNEDDPWIIEEAKNIKKELTRYYNNKKSFLAYQHGVWVLAHGRDDLNKGMKIVGNDIVQVDTDSVKHLEDYRDEFNELNRQIIKNASNFDLPPYATKSDGTKVYLGIWEHEGPEDGFTYAEFRTLGSKKYCTVDNDGIITPTVSGLNKKCGWYIQDKGGLEFFKHGSKFPARTKEGKSISGRTSATYRDFKEPFTITVNGHEITMGSCIAINDVEYTLGMTGEWFGMILEECPRRDFVETNNGVLKGWY